MKPHRPSRDSLSAVYPFFASMHATTPFEAAIPAWSGLVMVPKFTRIPELMLAVIPNANLNSSSSSPRSLLEAAAAPNAPIVPVVWKPWV